MCGIAGVLSFGEFSVTPEYVTKMRETLVHRGPDGANTWVSDDRRVGLGFRRLAIIDLSPAAMQPMENEDGSVRLLMNGEIYNHAELRPELEAAGHRFRTDHADTEVVVHAFEEWGIDCVHRLPGHVRARDLGRAGAAPLARARPRRDQAALLVDPPRALVFGSEIKALLADPEQPRAVDEEALYHYLSFLTTPAPLTMFAGIRKLPAASWLRVDRGRRDRRGALLGSARRGRAARRARRTTSSPALILDELRTSVEYRKVSDVPVGIFLSGGLDSSTNAVLFAQGEEQPVQTFSIGYDADYPSYPNELAWARRVAKNVGADHHERILSLDDVLGFLPRLVEFFDEPIADPVAVPIYHVSELARQNGVIVAQAGEGADELFWGYPSWRDAPAPPARQRPAGSASREAARPGGAAALPGKRRLGRTSSSVVARRACPSSGAAPRRSRRRRRSGCSRPAAAPGARDDDVLGRPRPDPAAASRNAPASLRRSTG